MVPQSIIYTCSQISKMVREQVDLASVLLSTNSKRHAALGRCDSHSSQTAEKCDSHSSKTQGFGGGCARGPPADLRRKPGLCIISPHRTCIHYLIFFPACYDTLNKRQDCLWTSTVGGDCRSCFAYTKSGSGAKKTIGRLASPAVVRTM